MIPQWNSLNLAIIKCYKKRTIFISSVWEMNFLSLFIWIWIDFNFPLKEPKDVSSKKILHVELRLLLNSFRYIKNKRGPRTEPCGTLHFTASQEELWLLRATLYWHSWRYSLKRFNSSPSIPYDSSLRRSSLWHTLSNALDTFRSTFPTFIVGLQSKEELISWTINNN